DALRQLRQLEHVVRQEDEHGSIAWIGLPPAPVSTGPSDRAHASAASKYVRLLGLHHDSHAHAVAVPLGEWRASKQPGLSPLRRRELIRHHQCAGLGAENAYAVYGSAADEQTCE